MIMITNRENFYQRRNGQIVLVHLYNGMMWPLKIMLRRVLNYMQGNAETVRRVKKVLSYMIQFISIIHKRYRH